MKRKTRKITINQLDRLIESKVKQKLHEKVSFASVYHDGVPLGVTDDGIYFLVIDTSGRYNSFTSFVLDAYTEDNIREVERKEIESDPEYYYTNVFDDIVDMGQDWDDLEEGDQQDAIDMMVDAAVKSRLDTNSGNFEYEWHGSSDDYYMDMVSAGQSYISENDITFPLVDKKILSLFDSEWKRTHLKDPKQTPVNPKVIQIYDKLHKNVDKLLDKAIRIWMIKSNGKDELLKKLRS